MTALDDCDEIYYPQLELEKENLGYLGGLFLDFMMTIDILQSCFMKGTVFHFQLYTCLTYNHSQNIRE